MNSIEDGHICRSQILRLRIFFSFVGGNPTLKNYKGEKCRSHILRLRFFSFVGGNPTLEIYKKERPPFSYKRGPLPLDLRGGKRETIGLLHQKNVGDPNDP